MKFKTKRKAWKGPSPKSNAIYLENYNKIFKRHDNFINDLNDLRSYKENIQINIKKVKNGRNIYEQFEINLLEDFGMDKEKIEAVKAKIIDSEKFNFNKEEVELIYKLTGFDLLTASEMRAALLLFSGLNVRRLDAKPD